MYSLYITNKHGTLVYHKNFCSGINLTANDSIRLASTFHGLSAIAVQLSPLIKTNCCSDSFSLSTKTNFLKVRGINKIEADNFKLQCFESLTGLKIFIVSAPNQMNIELYISRLYDSYCDYVLKNPFYDIDMPIRCSLFDREVDIIFAEFIKN